MRFLFRADGGAWNLVGGNATIACTLMGNPRCQLRSDTSNDILGGFGFFATHSSSDTQSSKVIIEQTVRRTSAPGCSSLVIPTRLFPRSIPTSPPSRTRAGRCYGIGATCGGRSTHSMSSGSLEARPWAEEAHRPQFHPLLQTVLPLNVQIWGANLWMRDRSVNVPRKAETSLRGSRNCPTTQRRCRRYEITRSPVDVPC